jgi:lauroyl-Kdo2-lipid IVA myristoyltransferase
MKKKIEAKKSNAVIDTGFKALYLHPRFLGTWLTLAASYIIFLLPDKFVDEMGNRMGDYFRKSSQKRSHIVNTNISLCFPEKTEEEKQVFMKKHFRAYGRSILHLAFILWGSKKTAEKRIVFHGKHYIDECMEQGDSVIVMTAHSVGLEAVVSTISRHYNLSGPIKEMKNAVINWFVAKRRMRYGSVLYSRKAGLRPIIKDVKNGYLMGYLPDEDLGKQQSIFVPFMGVEKATIPVLGRIAKTCKAKVFPCISCYDEEEHMYHVHVLPALENFPQLDDPVDTLSMNQALESVVKICPEQYFWTMKFFKTRPEGEESVY